MKFPRYILALCALFFFAIIVSAEVETEELNTEETDSSEDIETRNPLLLRAAIAVIKQAAKWAAKHCLEEAANNCKQHWKNPKELTKCGKAFLQRNKGRCASG